MTDQEKIESYLTTIPRVDAAPDSASFDACDWKAERGVYLANGHCGRGATGRELAELVGVLAATGRSTPKDVAKAIEDAAAEHGFELTPERVALWTGAVTRGEIGLTEILIAVEPPPVGLRGKRDCAIVDEDAQRVRRLMR